MAQKVKKKTVYRDVFGHLYFLKRSLIFILGGLTYNRYNGFNKLEVKGTAKLRSLPKTHVLFVSNHQTYFADVFAMYHVFCSVQNGFIDTIKNPVYLLNPKIDFYYVAAEETMKDSFLTKLFAYTGAVTVQRTWRSKGENVQRKVNLNEISNIDKAIQNGWVVTFPQGTTKAFAPGRRGTAHLIKTNKPIVIPVVIDGFRRAFDKKGLIIKKKGIRATMTFKDPLDIDYENDTSDEIMKKIMDAIEQSPEYNKVKPIDEILDEIKDSSLDDYLNEDLDDEEDETLADTELKQ
ncbi:lysophospholipid acyltransferase family protein [Vaginella massiliensis]|uniref:lysophospholipid acyltransferase family protein n=1 Tax=Vaginella massiliensis TaxID=1816680 RepID=UPI000838798C|nr:lysophospholipid acyltransferase family protein [Vaginella massiliensis]